MQLPGFASQSIVEAIDTYPTLADLSNVPVPLVEGRSFPPLFPPKTNVLSYWNCSGTNDFSAVNPAPTS